MPKETPNHKLRYPEKGDPDTLAAYWQHLAEDTERELDAIGLDQLVIPGSSDGKLVVVKDGGAVLAAMSGDATFDEDGVLQLGSKVVGTNELGDKAVTGAKVDDGTLGDGKLTSPNNATWKELMAATGVTTSSTQVRNTKLTICEVKAEGRVLNAISASGVQPALVHIVPAGLAVAGKETELRLRSRLFSTLGSTAGEPTVEIALRKLEGKAIGAAVTGSGRTFKIAPASFEGVLGSGSAEFDIPAEGFYVVTISTDAEAKTAGNLGLSWELDYRNV